MAPYGWAFTETGSQSVAVSTSAPTAATSAELTVCGNTTELNISNEDERSPLEMSHSWLVTSPGPGAMIAVPVQGSEAIATSSAKSSTPVPGPYVSGLSETPATADHPS